MRSGLSSWDEELKIDQIPVGAYFLPKTANIKTPTPPPCTVRAITIKLFESAVVGPHMLRM